MGAVIRNLDVALNRRELWCHTCAEEESFLGNQLATLRGEYWRCVTCDEVILCEYCGQPWTEDGHDGGPKCKGEARPATTFTGADGCRHKHLTPGVTPRTCSYCSGAE